MSIDKPINPNWDAKTQMEQITTENGKMATSGKSGTSGAGKVMSGIGGAKHGSMKPGTTLNPNKGMIAGAMGAASKGSAKPTSAANAFGAKKMSSGQGGAKNSNVRGIVKGGK